MDNTKRTNTIKDSIGFMSPKTYNSEITLYRYDGSSTTYIKISDIEIKDNRVSFTTYEKERITFQGMYKLTERN